MSGGIKSTKTASLSNYCRYSSVIEFIKEKFSNVFIIIDLFYLSLSETTKDLQDVINKNELILSLRHIKPKKRLRGIAETLFSITFPQTENKFALLLDRKTKRGKFYMITHIWPIYLQSLFCSVIVETLEEGKKRVQYFTVDILEEDSVVKSLILAINQKKPGAHATLYINCNSYGIVATPKTVREMFKHDEGNKVEVVCNKNSSFISRYIFLIAIQNNLCSSVKEVFSPIFDVDFI